MVLPVVLGLVASGLFAVLISYLISSHREVSRTERILSGANELQRVFIDAETGLRGFVVTGQDKFLEPYENARQTWPSKMDILKKAVSDNPTQIRRLNAIQEKFRDYLSFSSEVIEIRRTRGIQGVLNTIGTGQGKGRMDELRDLWSEFSNEESTLRRERTEQSEATATGFMIVVVGLTIVIAGFSAIWGRKQIVSLSNSYEELAADQARKNEYLEKNEWVKGNKSQLAELMLQKRNIEDFCHLTLNSLAKICSGDVGIFFLKEKNQTFRRVSHHALPDMSVAHYQTFQLGQGIIGEAVKDNSVKVLKDLPPAYFSLKSGLGTTDAKSVVIIPITNQKDCIGVIELGFLEVPTGKTLELLNEVGEMIGSALQSIQDHLKLENLFREVQAQAEELQAQEEELRASNEELESQSNMLKQSQVEMEAQNVELEQTNSQLQDQAKILEEQKDLLERRNEELYKTRREIEGKALDLQKVSQYKTEFLANMSHELRTPLNSSLILAQLLIDNKDNNLSPKQVDYAKQILSSGNDLLVLINDILDLSKVESGKLDLNIEKFNVGSLARGLEKMFAAQADEKSLKLRFDLPNDTFEIESDRVRLEQILKNLIANAIKFTGMGSVDVIIKKDGEKALFQVKDTGIGIASDQQSVIFEAFKQADGTTSRKFGGTGLGLSISKNLAEVLGGRIEVQSDLGKGSTFTLTLPLSNSKLRQYKGQQHARNVASTYVGQTQHIEQVEKAFSSSIDDNSYVEDDRNQLDGGNSKAVLIIEDDRKFAELVRDLVRERGFKCLVTDSAEVGLALAFKFKPSAVVLDIKLPDHSGLVVLDQLKRNTETRYIPVHIISVDDFSPQAFQLGAVGYVLKPVTKERLVKSLDELAKRIVSKNKNVLVIEDDERQQAALKELLEDEFIKVTQAMNGSSALAEIKKGKVDCVVLDLRLPDMSGFDLLEKMNAIELNHLPPVIVYTGQDLSRDDEYKLRRHSGSIIVKGARSPERLLDEVLLFVNRLETSLPESHKSMLSRLRTKDQSLAGKKVLLVDDDLRNIFATAAALEQRGAIVNVAKDGQQAVDAIFQGEAQDVVLMDIMMPVMDGYEATRNIRENKKFSNLPIIALTAKAMKDDREKALQAGANDYITKPVDVDRLVSLIRVWTTRVQ